MTNLLEETLVSLEQHDKKIEDVLWIGSPDYGYMTWREFCVVANVLYDNDFGIQHVASDLVIVGDIWWLERYEYDGSESWQYKELPVKPIKHVQVVSVDWGMWSTLKDISRSDI